METNEKINYKVEFKSKNSKPKNLLFNIEGKDETYSSLEELSERLKGVIEENYVIKINWKWDYEKGNAQDIQDTQDGKMLKQYEFMINVTGNI